MINSWRFSFFFYRGNYVKLIQKHGMVPKMYGNVHGDYPLFQTYTNLTAVRMFFFGLPDSSIPEDPLFAWII